MTTRVTSQAAESRWLDLVDDTCRDVALVGGKAAVLAQLAQQADAVVPRGAALPAASLGAFLEAGRDEQEADLSAALGDVIAGRSWAVRSSALDEDGATRSFAGQYESFLGLTSADQILDAIAACADAATAPRVVAYRRAAAAAAAEPPTRIGVVVQELVHADRSGVAFTTNPVDGRTETVINAGYGLGDLLVGGRVTPDEIIVRPGVAPQIEIGSKRLMSVPTPDGVRVLPVPDVLRAECSLSGKQIDAVVRLAARCEAHLGAPADVEWAFARGTLHLLQARPITTTAALPQEER